ncbi:Duf55 domain of thymocyte nuclear protein 1 [Dipodascopsis tothii]|uniref:Duf55 domain of thymocyte nuclear protein 1 n=1 Tax=Dipodascopsis tothii TaxID=44089 RepID=UPI0034CEBABE
MKAEPDSRIVDGVDVKFSIDDLEAGGTSSWDGVRNHEAKNHMRRMNVGDLAFFYHSNCKTPGIAGVMRICRAAYVDHTAFDRKHPYYDARSDPAAPKWFMVDVEFVRRLDRFVPLAELRATPALANMALMTRSRLSVSPVRAAEWQVVEKMAQE